MLGPRQKGPGALLESYAFFALLAGRRAIRAVGLDLVVLRCQRRRGTEIAGGDVDDDLFGTGGNNQCALSAVILSAIGVIAGLTFKFNGLPIEGQLTTKFIEGGAVFVDEVYGQLVVAADFRAACDGAEVATGDKYGGNSNSQCRQSGE